MARFVFKRDNGEQLSWTFEPEKLLSPEAELIERLTGWTFRGWIEKFQNGSVLAIHALLFVLMKRADPQLAFDDVEFSISQIDMDYDDDEIAAAIDVLKSNTDRGPVEQAQLDQLLLRQVDVEVPKGTTEVTAPTTGSGGSPDSPPN